MIYSALPLIHYLVDIMICDSFFYYKYIHMMIVMVFSPFITTILLTFRGANDDNPIILSTDLLVIEDLSYYRLFAS